MEGGAGPGLCSGESLSGGVGGGQGCGGRESRRPAAPPAPRRDLEARASPPRPLRIRSFASERTRPRWLPVWPSRPRRLSSDQREPSLGAGASAPGPLLPDPLTLPVGTGAKGPLSPRQGLVRVPTPLPAPGLELPNTSSAVWGRDTPPPLRPRRGSPSAAGAEPAARPRRGGKPCSGARPRGPGGPGELSEEPRVLPRTCAPGLRLSDPDPPRPSTEARGGDATAAP